jgi:hypothetical protein
MSEDRRNIEPEFYEAVKFALAKMTRFGDHVSAAKVLWTNPQITVMEEGGALKTIDNPHHLGRNVDKIESTIRAMYGRS